MEADGSATETHPKGPSSPSAEDNKRKEPATKTDPEESLGAVSQTLSLPSSPMTDDEEQVEDDGGISEKSTGPRRSCAWKGRPLDEMGSEYLLPGPLAPSADHSIMFRPHVDPYRPPRPYPDTYRDVADDDHVWMPCSPLSRLSGPDRDRSGSSPRRRWDVIEEALRAKMTTCSDIQEAILTYNKNMSSSWRFEALHSLLHEEMTASEAKDFFERLLPRMVSAALNLPNLVTSSIPLLRSGRSHSLSLTQQQCASLLANAFFCTFIYRRGVNGDFPGVNFFGLLNGPVSPRKFEKLRTLLHYFRRVLLDEMPCGTVTFTRRCLENDQLPNWSRLDAELPAEVHVASEGMIEDDGVKMLQIDFANKRIGGGVLRHGLVQEEIRFIICPEMILSRLFTETLAKNEALVIVGAERFSNYSGYGDTYAWAGNHVDTTPRDSWGRRQTCVVAIDATRFNRSQDQFAPAALKRELDKAFVGFEWAQLPRTVATGNWGCGAFRGNHELKALLQLMACSAARCRVVYFTFGDEGLRDRIFTTHQRLRQKGKRVRDVWRMICNYWNNNKAGPAGAGHGPRSPKESLYEFIDHQLDADTNDEASGGSEAEL